MKRHILSSASLRLAGLGMVFLTAACAGTPVADRSEYACTDGERLSVSAGMDAAQVTLKDGTRLSLPKQKAASGFWYSSGKHDLRGKGDEAHWSVGRKAAVRCVVAR